jgi:hypothetical protein
MGLAAFAQRADALEAKFGAGFELTDAVKDAIQRHQPQY